MSDLRAEVEAAIAERHLQPAAGGEQLFLCPAHDDHHPSARYHPGKGVWHCDVCGEGGGYVDLAKRLGITLNGSEGGRPKAKGKGGKLIARYPYVDEAGDLLFEVVRFEPKDFRQRKPDGNGGWLWSLKGTRRVLYNLPEVIQAVKEKRFILLVEGEKDADNLTMLGFVATTAPQGAGKWQKTFTETLEGARIALIPDRDEAGEKHKGTVISELGGAPEELRVVELPTGKDVSDWLDTSGSRDELKRLVKAAKPVEAPQKSDLETEVERLREENKRLKGQMLVDDNASRRQILEALSEQLGLTVTAVIKYGSDESTYEIEVEGSRVQVGGIERFMEQKPLKLRIADVCGKLMRGFSKEAWRGVTDLMLRAIETRTVDESSGRDTVLRWLSSYLSHNPPVTDADKLYNWQSAAVADRPFAKDGDVWLSLTGLRFYLKNRHGEAVAVKEIAELLTKHGGSSERISGSVESNGQTRSFRKRFWTVPDELLSELRPPEENQENTVQNSEEYETVVF